MQAGYWYEDFQSFLAIHDLFEILRVDPENQRNNYLDNESDLDDGQNDYYDQDLVDGQNDYYDQEDEKLLTIASKLETWPFENVVCSYIFYNCSNDIKRDGYVSTLTWKNMAAHLTSPLIAIELLPLIKRNGFFELNPTTAIKGTLYLFKRELCQLILFDFDKPGTESSILRILNCLEIDPKIGQELTNQTLKNKDFSFIVTFLENYTFPKARRISQQELDSFLNCLQLTEAEKCRLAQDAINKLENSDKNWVDLVSSWNEYTFPMVLNIDSYQEDLIAEKNKISEVWTKETYFALAQLKAAMVAFKHENLDIVTYPPIDLVQKYLQTNASELNSSIVTLLFPKGIEVPLSQKTNRKTLNLAQMSKFFALIAVLWAIPSNIGLVRRNNSAFSMTQFPSFTAINIDKTIQNSEYDHSHKLVGVSKRVPTNSSKQAKIINTNQEETSKNQQASKTSIAKKSPNKVRMLGHGYTEIGHFGSFAELKKGRRKTAADGYHGPRLFDEQIDYLLPTDTREIINPKRDSIDPRRQSSTGDTSIAVIVPGWYNRRRTDKQARALRERPPEINYIEKPCLQDLLIPQVKLSANDVVWRRDTFTPREQKIIEDLERHGIFLQQIADAYNLPCEFLAKQIDENFIEVYNL